VRGAAFAGRDSADDKLIAELRGVLVAALGVERAFAAGYALDDEARIFSYEH
jgi:hypothetical protein